MATTNTIRRDAELPRQAVSTLRPGFLVSMHTSIQGNVTYEKRILEARSIDKKSGKEKEKWETARVVDDPKELEAAKAARGKAANLIRGVCSFSKFGLLCPNIKEEELMDAVKQARSITEAFNAKAQLSQVYVHVLVGRVSSDDVEAVRSINSEVRGLVKAMEDGVKTLDAKLIRDAANKLRSVGAMLNPEAEAKAKLAIDAARRAARDIVKAGETAAATVDKAAMRKLSEVRTSFLDLDEVKEVARPAARGRTVDLMPEEPGEAKAPARKTTSRVVDIEETLPLPTGRYRSKTQSRTVDVE